MSWRLNPITVCLGLAALVALWLLATLLLQLLGPATLLLTALGAGLVLLLRPPGYRRGAGREAGWRCLGCGYDLRMSGETCPECGAPIPEDLRRRRRIAAELRPGQSRADLRRLGPLSGRAAAKEGPVGPIERIESPGANEGGADSCS
jgi:hypothetical protein